MNSALDKFDGHDREAEAALKKYLKKLNNSVVARGGSDIRDLKNSTSRAAGTGKSEPRKRYDGERTKPQIDECTGLIY